jgi:hypothetical protein
MQHRNVLSLVKGFTGAALFSLAASAAHADGNPQPFVLSLLSPSLAAPRRSYPAPST